MELEQFEVKKVQEMEQEKKEKEEEEVKSESNKSTPAQDADTGSNHALVEKHEFGVQSHVETKWESVQCKPEAKGFECQTELTGSKIDLEHRLTN